MIDEGKEGVLGNELGKPDPWMDGGGEGGGCTASLKVGTHCQTNIMLLF